MLVGTSLSQAAQRWPHKTAIVFEGMRWSFRNFDRLVNRLAHALRANGIRHGDRLAFLVYNRPEQIIGYYALLKLGAVPIPINYRLGQAEIQYILEDADARGLIFEEALRGLVDSVDSDLKTRIHIGEKREPAGPREVAFWDLIAGGSDQQPEANLVPTDPAFIMYTSGTTGAPKGVVRSHRAEMVGAMIMALECGFRHDDIVLANSPLFHIGQLQLQLLPFVHLGATNVITRGFEVEETLSTCVDEGITVLHGVPTQLVSLADAEMQRFDLSRLRIGFFGGQTLADDVVARLVPLFPEFFANVYGSTEALAVTFCDYRRHPDKLGSAGKAALNMEAKIVPFDTDANAGSIAAGQQGQLLARGPTLMDGYLGLPEKTAAALAGDWYHTGDAAVMDDEGFVTVLGRMDHTIKSGGENVHPSEVENVLFEHPAVADAAVIGLPDRQWGELVAAVIVTRDNELDAQKLDQLCLDAPSLASFKRPRRYLFVDEIPASPTGKVDRARLRELLGDIEEAY